MVAPNNATSAYKATSKTAAPIDEALKQFPKNMRKYIAINYNICRNKMFKTT